MKTVIMKTEQLTKVYGSQYALRDVSITLLPGRIYGLIGKNGAGKSTLMRLAAGLSYPTKGSIELFGKTTEREQQMVRKRMGCMIEQPSLNLNLSAAENMRRHRILRGIPDETAEKELLEMVGLSGTGKKKAKDFSLGMKQRLGIAVALLNNPEFLILDEPINGLDPLGVIEVRKLLERLCRDHQITILISSHNLPELYQVATDYIIIDAGEVRQTLTQAELEERCRHHLLISCTDTEKLVSVLETGLEDVSYKVMPDKSVKLYGYLDEREKVARLLSENGLLILNFSMEGDTLENYFLSAIGGEYHD